MRWGARTNGGKERYERGRTDRLVASRVKMVGGMKREGNHLYFIGGFDDGEGLPNRQMHFAGEGDSNL